MAFSRQNSLVLIMPINELGFARKSPLPRAPTPERKILIFPPEQSTTRGLVAQKFRQQNSKLFKDIILQKSPSVKCPSQVNLGALSTTSHRQRGTNYRSLSAQSHSLESLPRVTANADIFRFSGRPHERPRRSSVRETALLAAVQAAEPKDPRSNYYLARRI